MSEIVRSELLTIVTAHLLALIPIGAVLLAGRMSPLYQVPSALVARWWSWCALILVASAVLLAAVGRLA